MPDAELPMFAAQYGSIVKEVFREQAEQVRADGEDLVTQARAFAARGKPDFVLAFLVAADLPDGEKRELLAQAFEARAAHAEQAAQDLNIEHQRPFPLIALEARKDRTMAQQVRQGKMIRPYARAPKPLNMH